jgi:hypothetical protein
MPVDLLHDAGQLSLQISIARVPLGHARILLPEHVGDRVLVESEFAHKRPAGVAQTVNGEPRTDLPLLLELAQELEDGVRRLIAGPAIYICDECVELALDFIEDIRDENLFRLMQGDEDSARIMSTEELAHYMERGARGVERNRLALDAIARKLAMREDEMPRPDDLLASPRFAYLKGKTQDELVAFQQTAQRELKRYEDALRIATTALGARRQ